MTLFLLDELLVAAKGEARGRAGQLEVTPRDNGEPIFVCHDAQWLNLAGEPQIPWRVLTVLLPPDVELSSLLVEVSKSRFESFPGTWTVPPTPPIVALDENQTVKEWPQGKRIIDGQDAGIYEYDEFWPAADIRLLGTGRLHRWQLAEIAIPLAKYNPGRGELMLLMEAEVEIGFRHNSVGILSTSAESFSRFGEKRVKKIAVNYEHAKEWYGIANISLFGAAEGEIPPAYVIITTLEIENTSSKLADFVAHKESLGFAVHIITEEDFGGGVGDEAAENIRAWLQANYIAENIEYVLLIGDPRPDIGEVPMKILYPEGRDPNNGLPSDLYYADLTGNWDLDGDGCYGEWGNWNDPNSDFGSGGIDRYWEVLVGRMPCYKTPWYISPYRESVKHLDRILAKTMEYESQTVELPEWRKKILLAMNSEGWGGFENSYLLGEAIKDDILLSAGWEYHRIYDANYGLEPPPETTPCTNEIVSSVWNNEAFGLAVWLAHGGTTISNGSELDDTHPSFTFQAACSEADPNNPDNLAYDLLRRGAVCTIGASSSANASAAGTFAGRTDASGMAYEYTLRIVSGTSSGQTLFDIKQTLSPPAGWGWKQFVIFNIYGDPAINIVPRIIFVDSDASGYNSGYCWRDAYNYLQDAFAEASEGTEIRVAQGTYWPDLGAAVSQNDRDATFQLSNRVTIKGGYAGFGTLNPNVRDVIQYETILTGEIGYSGAQDNSYHVWMFTESGASANLDGFTISDGRADGNDIDSTGGAIYQNGGYLTVCNCTFRNNYAASHGGGIYSRSGHIMLDRCNFVVNNSRYGGAMMNYSSHPTLTYCLFSGNRGHWGGAINNQFSSSLLKNCTFCQNSGGALWSHATHSELTNCILWGDAPQEISHNDTGSITKVSYSDIQTSDGIPWPGEGNICIGPLFANRNNGDYHLKSQAGRWNPIDELWEIDEVDSPCIDKGDPNSLVGDEPEPNGGVINMGAYGGTAQASKSSADAQ